MRIALVILHADPARGGAERYTLDVSSGLADRGHDVTLIASSFADGIDRRITRVTLGAAGFTRRRRYLGFLNAVETHLNQTAYDRVHAMLPVRRCDLYHPHAGLAADAVTYGHRQHAARLRQGGSWVANRLNRKRQAFAAVERQLLTGAHPPVVLCLSEYVQRTVQAHYPNLTADRLARLFNAVDIDRFNPERDPATRAGLRQRLGIAADAVVALFVGHDYARKGLHEALQAIGRIEDPRLRLLIVGPPLGAPQRRWVSRLGLADRVIAPGPQRDTYPFYQAADFFVLPTRHDPCSLVVLESLAMGLPVISTRYNGATEIMTPAHGFVLDTPGDIAQLAGAIRTLLDPATRTAMSQAALALRPRISQPHHLDTLEQIYVESGSRVE